MAGNSKNRSEEASNFTEFEDRVSSYSTQGPIRKTPPSGDHLGDILEILYSEHRYISSLLETLEQQAERLAPGKIPDYQLLLEMVDYLTHYPGQYHHPREDLLFASMLKSDSKFKPKLDRLLREHSTLDRYNRELLNELTLIADGRRVNRPELLQSIKRFLAGYREHIDYESREIFPRAKGTLKAADLKKLSEKTRYIDDPLFGGEIQYRYKRVSRSLQTRVEIASSQIIAREMSGIESFIGNLTVLANTVDLLNSAIKTQGREAWREQLDTIKVHRPGEEGPGLLSLPVALAKNHRRHLTEGYGEIREILARPRSTDQSRVR